MKPTHVAVYETKSGLRAMMIDEPAVKQFRGGRKTYITQFADTPVNIHYQVGISPGVAKDAVRDQLGPLFGI